MQSALKVRRPQERRRKRCEITAGLPRECHQHWLSRQRRGALDGLFYPLQRPDWNVLDLFIMDLFIMRSIRMCLDVDRHLGTAALKR